MNAAQCYLETIDSWETLAAKQHFAAEWVETMGEAIAGYLRRCNTDSYRPTFLGLMLYLSEIAPRATQAGEGGIDG